MTEIDAKNAHFYSRKKFPLMAVATVRMQSEVWEQEILAARASSQPPAEADSGAGDGIDDGDGQQPPTENTPDPNGTPANLPDPECEGGEYGLGSRKSCFQYAEFWRLGCGWHCLQLRKHHRGLQSEIAEQASHWICPKAFAK
jgi:hypothetical protein